MPSNLILLYNNQLPDHQSGVFNGAKTPKKHRIDASAPDLNKPATAPNPIPIGFTTNIDINTSQKSRAIINNIEKSNTDMIQAKYMSNYNFLSYRFPNAGQFYSDPECHEPLFIGKIEVRKNKIYIKILSVNSYLHCCDRTLYARFSSDCDLSRLVSYTFFGCKLNGDPFTKYHIDFISFASHDNDNRCGNPDNSIQDKGELPCFIEQDQTFKQISFEIHNLDKWFWSLGLDEEAKDRKLKNSEFTAEYIDNKGNIYKGYRNSNGYDKSIIKMQIPLKSLKKTIKLNKETSLILCSEPDTTGSHFPNFTVRQSSRIDIITKNPQQISFFFHIIDKVQQYLSLLTLSECKICSIQHFIPYTVKNNEFHRMFFYDNRLVWGLEQTEDEVWHVGYHMTYRKLQKDFGTSIKSFLEKYDILYSLVHFFLDSDRIYRKNYLELYVATQIQMIEIYGNFKSQTTSRQTRADVISALSEIPDKAFDLIFLHNYKTRNSIPCYKIFGEISYTKNTNSDEIQKYRDILTKHLSDLRNFVIHPFYGGELKKAQNENIYPFWCCPETNGLNLQAISYLSVSLNKIIRFLILKEIGLENYFYTENE